MTNTPWMIEKRKSKAQMLYNTAQQMLCDSQTALNTKKLKRTSYLWLNYWVWALNIYWLVWPVTRKLGI